MAYPHAHSGPTGGAVRLPRNRRWRDLGLAASLAVLMVATLGCVSTNASPAQSPPPIISSVDPIVAKVKLTKDAAFSKIVRFLAIKGITPSVSDKETAVITASGATIRGKIIDSSTRSNQSIDCRYVLSISVDATSEDDAVVEVRLSGEMTQMRYKHFLIIPIFAVKTQVACHSTGVLEKELFDYLR